MKNIRIKILSYIIALTILVSATTPLSAYSGKADLCDVMIYANEQYFGDIETAREQLLKIVGNNIEITDTYSLALFGFSARLPKDYIATVNSSRYFDAHECGYYTPLSVAEYSAASSYASEMINVYQAHDTGYSGSNTVVAVIDNGFDITHEVFSALPKSPAITKSDVDRLIADNRLNTTGAASLEGIYVSDKIPFVFNYASKSADVSALDSHGTHVAAIIGGNSDTLTGVAPDCQLLLMKVFDQSSKNASEQYVVSALEDAIALGADVVNLSLGTYSGSSEANKYSSMDKMAKRLTDAGITVVCAAGNDGTTGDTSSYAAYLDIPYPLAKTPDYGTLNHPASITEYIAVASAQNTHVAYDTLVHIDEKGDIRRIKYTDTNASLGIIAKTFTKHFDKQELEYVVIPGLGEQKDYDDINATGKIALIERGIVSFIDKVNTAESAGAVAAVIYDNVDSDEEVHMELAGCRIPAVFISKEDGEYLKAAMKKTLSFDSALSELIKNDYAYRMSDFSSWGVTPEFTLKPDITSIGESVYSAASGGTYTSLSGTSMATPFISGIAALMSEKLNLTESKYILSKRPQYLKTVLMNSAKPLINPDTNAEYSPRQQGAGLADISSALKAEVLLTNADGEPSLLLQKENTDTNKFSLEFTVSNITSAELDVILEATFLCDEYASATLEDESQYIFNSLTSRKLGKTVITTEENSKLTPTDKQNIYSVKLGTNQEYTGKLYITLDSDELAGNDVFEDGYFIDGYLYARTADSESSIPFTGFNGDFNNASVFDSTVYEETLPFFTGNALVSEKEDESYAILGSADGTVNGAAKNLVAFSPNSDGVFDTLSFSPSLLRNVSGLSVDILSQTGEVVYSESYTNTPFTKGGAERNNIIPLWDGNDGLYEDFIFPDGKYTAEITAYLKGQKSNQKLSLDFFIDTSAPKYWLKATSNENGAKTVTFSLKDNHAIKSIKFYNNAHENIELASLDALPENDQPATLTYDVSHVKEKQLWADITDYAMNTKTVKIRIP